MKALRIIVHWLCVAQYLAYSFALTFWLRDHVDIVVAASPFAQCAFTGAPLLLLCAFFDGASDPRYRA